MRADRNGKIISPCTRAGRGVSDFWLVRFVLLALTMSAAHLFEGARLLPGAPLF